MSCCMPESKRCLCYEGKDKMSEQKQTAIMKDGSKIITGLRLSEAIKYLEENEVALIALEDTVSHMNDFRTLDAAVLIAGRTYSVKLPPPKSVSVTRADIEKAFFAQFLPLQSNADALEALCKELGL